MTTPQDSAREEAKKIVFESRDFTSCSECDDETSVEIYPGIEDRIAQALLSSHQRGFKDGVEASAKVAESGFLYGDDCKDDDYACSRCGGDIRGHCCKWQFNHDGNKEVAKAIRQLKEKES